MLVLVLMSVLVGCIREGAGSWERRNDWEVTIPLRSFAALRKGERGAQEEVGPEKMFWTMQALSGLRCLKGTHRKEVAVYFLKQWV